MRGTKHLNPFFRLHEISEVLSSSQGLSNLLIFMGKVRSKDKTILHCSQGCKWGYSMEHNVNCLYYRACWDGMFFDLNCFV